MALIHGSSPRFKAPWPAWGITALGERRGSDGRLDLRVGNCRGPERKTPAERMEALDRRRRSGDPIAAKGDLRSSLVPVVLVDGEPVAAGWGRIDLPLPAGRHLVEVQSQHSRAWRAVTIEPGKAAKLDYVGILGEQHRAYATREVRGESADFHGYTLGPRGRLDYWQYLPANARSRRSFIVAMLVLLLSSLLTWTAAAVGVPDATAILTGTGIWAGALAFWAARVWWTCLRYNRCQPEPPLEAGSSRGLLAPLVIDHDGTPPGPRPGSAAVLIDARFLKTDLESAELALQLPPGQERINGRQRRRLDALGEIEPMRHRFAVPPPRIELDGKDLAASWTRMWIETAPGHHRIRVRTPEAPLPSEQAPPDTGTIDIDVAEGETAPIEVTVTVKAVPDPTEPRLHHWECRIERFARVPDRPNPAAPKADVRGGLRRAATGRWWERTDR